MENVLVTGGNGFIGRYVTRELLDRGYSVTVLDTRYREPEPGCHVMLGDIRDAVSVTEAIAHSDGVIHLAGVLGTQETIKNPRPAAEVNILGGLNILEACAQYDIPLVNIAVGNYWMANTYSITKNSVERFVEMFVKYRGSRMTIVRALNAYGPGQSVAAPFGSSKVRKIMPAFICRALSGMPVEIYGDGLQVMDMVHVADVARVLVSALEETAKQGPMGTLSIGSGRPTTVNEIARIAMREVYRQTRIDADLVHIDMRPGEDAGSIVLGDPLTLEPLGIKPSDLVKLEDGIVDTVKYFREYLANG